MATDPKAGPYRLERGPAPGEWVLHHASIPAARLSLVFRPQTETERLVMERLLALLNGYDGTPQGELPREMASRRIALPALDSTGARG